MNNLFNFDLLFSDSNNSKNLSKNQVNKNFDEFIKESFATYLYKSAIFKKYAKIYDQDSSFTDECNDLYILSEQLYLNAIKKIQMPFDVKFNKSNNLYIFNLKDIHNDDFIFKDSSDGRIFRPKKQKYLCKIISLIFVKLYILIKGIYTTFNHNLTYQEFISSRRKSKSLQESSETPETAETAETHETPENSEISQTGGGLLDNIRSFFKGNSNEDHDDEPENNEEFYDKELKKNIQDDKNDENDDDDNDDNEKPKKKTKKIKYNNIFFAFINSIFDEDINQTESKLIMELPTNLEEFTKNLKNSGMFDILCDTDYIYNAFKKNILFNKNSMNKVYETSPIILQKIKQIENELLSEYNSKLETKDKELKSTFENLQKYNKLCSKLESNFIINDHSRIYERIIKIVKQMFTDYTSYRNKLFSEIILKVFEFKEKIIKDENGNIKEIKNNIIRIKDNITYKEIIKLTSNAKIVIYDLHINFFNSLTKIFELLNENKVISKGYEQPQPIIDEEYDPQNTEKISTSYSYESKPEPEPEPEPRSDSQDEPRSDSHDEPRADSQDEPRSDSHDEPRADSHDEPRSDSHDEPRADSHDEPRADSQDEPRADSQDEPRADSQDEPRADSQPEPDADSQPETQPELESDPESESQDKTEKEITSRDDIQEESVSTESTHNLKPKKTVSKGGKRNKKKTKQNKKARSLTRSKTKKYN